MTLAPIRSWLSGPLPADVRLALDRLADTEGVAHVAVMPDVHLSPDVCNGVVVAAEDRIFPAAVGGDIGCGMTALGFDCGDELLGTEAAAARVIGALQELVPVMHQPKGRELELLPDLLRSTGLSDDSLTRAAGRDGLVQFGTLGRGNHFVELQVDEAGKLWLMIHSGSRAMGQAIRDFHLRHAKKSNTGLTYLESASSEGQAYIHDAAWATQYARLSRARMAEQVSGFLQSHFGIHADPRSWIDSPHNFLRLENHFGADFWVHRKGAMCAASDESGVIPGSMGTVSFHVTGRGLAEALNSSAHGAGRILSRTEARRKISARMFRREVGNLWYDHRLERALLEEAPGAYKDIRAVMRAQADLVRIVRTLRPLLVHKGA